MTGTRWSRVAQGIGQHFQLVLNSSTKIKVIRQTGESLRERQQGGPLCVSVSGVSPLGGGLLVCMLGLWASWDNPGVLFEICSRKAKKENHVSPPKWVLLWFWSYFLWSKWFPIFNLLDSWMYQGILGLRYGMAATLLTPTRAKLLPVE